MHRGSGFGLVLVHRGPAFGLVLVHRGSGFWDGLVLREEPPGCAFFWGGHLWVAFMAAFLVHWGSGFWAGFGTQGPGFWAGFGTARGASWLCFLSLSLSCFRDGFLVHRGSGFGYTGALVLGGFCTQGPGFWAGMDQRPPCRLPQKADFGKSIPFPFQAPDLRLFSDESIPLILFGAKRYAFIFCSLSGTLSCESKKHTFFFLGTRFAAFFRQKHTSDPVWGEKVCFCHVLKFYPGGAPCVTFRRSPLFQGKGRSCISIFFYIKKLFPVCAHFCPGSLICGF